VHSPGRWPEWVGCDGGNQILGWEQSELTEGATVRGSQCGDGESGAGLVQRRGEHTGSLWGTQAFGDEENLHGRGNIYTTQNLSTMFLVEKHS
jgi:hypothetical protein